MIHDPSKDEWRDQLHDCLQVEDGLSDWEVEFLESLAHSADVPSFTPSERQAAALHQIWEDMT